MQAVVVTAPGGPEVLDLRELPDPVPGPAQVLVRVEAAGVNYHDVNARRGLSGLQVPPFVAGVEGAGVIVECGVAVTDLVPGQRVAWPFVAGSWAELAAVPAASAVPVPDGVSAEQAASIISQGLTAHFLTADAHPVAAATDVLVHAGAGGVGRLVVRLAAHRGARVLATTSSGAKAPVARAAGAAEVLGYRGAADRVRELTGGAGVRAVFDGVGAATFEASLASLARRGTLVLYGVSSGPVPPFDLQRLSRMGSPYITRPALSDFIEDRAALLDRAEAVFGLVAGGVLDVVVTGRYALADAAEAQRRIAERSSTGKHVLTVAPSPAVGADGPSASSVPSA